MIEKGKISSLQMAIMIFPAVVATGDLLLPAVMSKHAGRDAWIPPIIASFIGYLTIYILFQLHKRYPKKTIIEYAEMIVGRLAGKTLTFLILCYFLISNGVY